MWMREVHGKILNNGLGIPRHFHPIKRYFRSCIYSVQLAIQALCPWGDVSVTTCLLLSFFFISYI